MTYLILFFYYIIFSFTFADALYLTINISYNLIKSQKVDILKIHIETNITRFHNYAFSGLTWRSLLTEVG